MNSPMNKLVPIKRDAKSGNLGTSRGRPVIGITHDGVKILKPLYPADHFTTAELRRAIAEVRAAKTK